MSQPTRIRSGHLTRRFLPAFCLLLLATLVSAGCRATWRTIAGGRAGAPPASGAQINRRDLLPGGGTSQPLGTRTLGRSTAATRLGAQSAVDAGAQTDKVDEYIEAEMLKQHIPGLSLGIVQGGKVVKIKAYGLANIELNVPATPSAVYQLQSITKSFVACGIMLLVEEGKIGLDDKITNYLSGLPQAWSGVTVRHLLAHTSGIPNFIGDQGSGTAIIAFSQKAGSSEEIIGWAAGRPLKFAPGEGWRYSSTGYHLLGMIIEKVSGKPWGQFLRERIFAPLGMTSTRLYSALDIIPNRASGYNHFGDVPVNGLWMTPAIMESAAGGLVSTVEDMARWEIGLEAGTIVKPSMLTQMEVPIKLKNDSIVQMNDGTRFGLGWQLRSYQGHRIAEHGGDHLTGFTANFSRFIDDKLAVIVLTNLTPLDIGGITRGVAAFYIPALLPAKTGEP